MSNKLILLNRLASEGNVTMNSYFLEEFSSSIYAVDKASAYSCMYGGPQMTIVSKVYGMISIKTKWVTFLERR